MPASMDPAPETAAVDPFLLDRPTQTAPFRAEIAGRALAERVQTEVKPLRPAKERPPVASAVDDLHVVGRAQVTTTVAPQPARRGTPSPGGAPGGAPPAAPPQAPAGPSPSAPPALGHRTFPGGKDNNTTIPPDTAGAVGPNHVFNPLNNNVWIFDRNGGSAAATVSLNNFWSGLGAQGHTFDPRVVYDPYAGRYIFATVADAGEPTSRLLVAASTNSDPLQWVSHAIQVDDAAQGAVWFDFPSIGFSADKITITVNLFTRADNPPQFTGATIYAIDKKSLYDPPHQAIGQRFILKNKGATHVPAVTYDRTLGDHYLVARWGGNIQGQGYIVVHKLAGNVALQQATLTQVGFLATPQTWDPFPPGDLGAQSGSSDLLSVGDDRVLGVCIRNGRLYCCQPVMLPTGTPTRSAVQWWEIDIGNWSVLQVGRIDDPAGAVCYTAPCISVNAQNDLLIAHAQFSGVTHPSGAYTLRTSGTPASPNVFAPGQNTYFKTFSGTTNRWGDYSHTQVDPANDLDFWTVQEFADAQANTWATMWAHISIPPGGTV